MFESQLVWRCVKVFRERLYRVKVSACGILRVIPTVMIDSAVSFQYLSTVASCPFHTIILAIFCASETSRAVKIRTSWSGLKRDDEFGSTGENLKHR
jgi:hypothetical protein